MDQISPSQMQSIVMPLKHRPIPTESYLSDKNTPPCLVLVALTAGMLADKIWLNFKIFIILYRLNYLDFYFVDISAMLLIVLEVHFSLFFSNKAYFRVFVVHKIRSPFFSYWSLLWGTSVPNYVLLYMSMHNETFLNT